MIIYDKNDLRISLITSRLIRVETKKYTDLQTQAIQNRSFCEAKYEITEDKSTVTVKTDDVCFTVDRRSGAVRSVRLSSGREVRDLKSGRLPGTARTLDMSNGAVKLEPGITSGSGASVMDDSKSLLLNPDGSISPREECTDRYYFAYGNDYLGQLKDFFKLTGRVPLIPKYALGNWWSRYRAYTQEEYRSLMQQFIDRELPITVATIDMDWHWTDVVDRFGNEARAGKARCPEEILYNTLMHGWTGYSWNTELFPDYRELLSWLHNNGFRVTLNIHPSQGVRFFEDGYSEMCRRLGYDEKKKECIPFDPTDPEFMKAYFEVLHHPYEDEGVDFWWIDWQQGTRTNIEGLDPLWALNHYHMADSGRGESRPLILSRFAGLGSHRYPLGFSGDTIVSWKSLDFQPYFTNCAANSGYTWWSHDIGGHARGVQDDELYIRWVQYGVFSPINRLHSSNSEYMGKEPWKRSYAAEKIAEDFLRLRHRLIPYIYTANYATHTEGVPICMPMYYRYDCPEAYECKNQYIFGGSLIVAPITRKADKRLNLSYTDVWLPEGRWTDILNGRIYNGGRTVRMYRDIDSIPVLAPEGGIIPMFKDYRTNDISLNNPLQIHLYRGNGRYELYEDDGESMAYERGELIKTEITLAEQGGTLHISLTPSGDYRRLVSNGRKITLHFADIEADDVDIILTDKPVRLEVKISKIRKNLEKNDLRCNILTRAQGSNDKKSLIFEKRLPAYIRAALSELDALWYE